MENKIFLGWHKGGFAAVNRGILLKQTQKALYVFENTFLK